MPEFRLKQHIEAIQLTYETALIASIYTNLHSEEYPEWFSDAIKDGTITVYVNKMLKDSHYCEVRTSKGIVTSSHRDYIVQGLNGEICILTEEEVSRLFEIV